MTPGGRRFTSLIAAAALAVAGAVASPSRAAHSSWACWEPNLTASSTARTFNCSLFLTGLPTGVRANVTSGTGAIHVAITVDVVTGVRGPMLAECSATRAASCQDSVSTGSQVIFPGAAGNTVIVWCHAEVPAGVAGSFACTSGYSL